LHYSLDYAVHPKSVRDIIADYLSHTADDFAHARHGFALGPREPRRRFLLQSILNTDGLDADNTGAVRLRPGRRLPRPAHLRRPRASRFDAPLGANRQWGWNDPTRSARGSSRPVRSLDGGVRRRNESVDPLPRPLSSCNYACGYCPFAKRTEARAELDHDRACLERFVGWVRARTGDRIGVLFTPWGVKALVPVVSAGARRTAQMPNVSKAAIQTNVSCKLDWVEGCDKAKLALWCTFHPGETTRERFLAKCRGVARARRAFQRRCGGVREHLADVRALRAELPPDVYLWVNAYKR
jgi:hypothetical protein